MVLDLEAYRARRTAPAEPLRYEVVPGPEHVVLRAGGAEVDRFSPEAALALGEHWLAAGAELLWRTRGVLVVQHVSGRGEVLARREASLVEHRRTAVLVQYARDDGGARAFWHDLATGVAADRSSGGWLLHPACLPVLRGLRVG